MLGYQDLPYMLQRFLKGRGGATGADGGKEAVATKDGGDEEGIKSEFLKI